jgi:hypothetical protein
MRLSMLETLETVGNIMSPEELIELEKLFEKLIAERNELNRVIDELRAEVNRLSQIAKY